MREELSWLSYFFFRTFWKPSRYQRYDVLNRTTQDYLITDVIESLCEAQNNFFDLGVKLIYERRSYMKNSGLLPPPQWLLSENLTFEYSPEGGGSRRKEEEG